MKKTLILASFLALASFAKGQLLLEALDAPNAFTSTQTRSYTGTFTKNNCSGADMRGTSVTYTQNATATATSYISQQDADNKAANEATAEAQRLVNQGGQAYANQNGSCDYYGSVPNCLLIWFHPDNQGGAGNAYQMKAIAKNEVECYNTHIPQVESLRQMPGDSNSRIYIRYEPTNKVWTFGFKQD